MIDLLAITLLVAILTFAWLMHVVKRRLRADHPDLWRELDDAASPLHTRVLNSAKLFSFILLGRYSRLEDDRLKRSATGARLLLLCFVIGGVILGLC